ncbi:hypothetical protein D920_00310 [Enterococcus faecalis 13-SD-W-01]|nr:hypothetical protein D920_00310 [Enterococcus faecalis 13-SD-W-01]
MLSKKIKKVKDLYYDSNNTNDYLRKCASKIELPDSVLKFIKNNEIEIFKIEHKLFPSEEWYFTLPLFRDGEFYVEYTTILKVSKLTSVYSLLHSFDVENRDPERMVPSLSGESDEPYIFMQSDFSKIIEDNLSKLNYERLKWAEGQRKIEGLKFANDVVLFGPDVTVSDMLFLDVLDATENWRSENLSK